MATIGGINLGNLTDFMFFYSDGSNGASWQGASKGMGGDVAIKGTVAKEDTSGSFGYAGTIFTDDTTLGDWQDIVDNNSPSTVSPAQAFASTGQTTLINSLEFTLNQAFLDINSLTVTHTVTDPENAAGSGGLDGWDSSSGGAQDGGPNDVFVINITGGLSVSSVVDITGDPGDVFIFRWDTDANFSNGYDGQVKFQSGGGFAPRGGLGIGNFIHVAGDINSSGGGSPLSAVTDFYPTGPNLGNGFGSTVVNGSSFDQGGFFTGYWLTTGESKNAADANHSVPYGKTSDLSNGIFVGGWYSITDQFKMTSGTSGVHGGPLDYGDLPEDLPGQTYITTRNISGASGPAHVITDTLFMGTNFATDIDSEGDGQPNATATGDNTVNLDDETAVTFPTFTPGQSANVTVSVTNNTGGDATLYGFIDWNKDGDFNDTGEAVTTTVSDGTAGNVTLTFNVPAGAVTGMDLGARFRLSTDSNLGATDPAGDNGPIPAPDGEVEDYLVQAGGTTLASIGDVVWNDVNQDGIQDAGEQGISGVTVSLDAGADGSIDATTTTDASGNYSFTGLTPGSYKVVFSQPTGFDSVSPFQQGGDSTVDSDADPNNGLMSDVITLSAGETNDTIDAGFFSTITSEIGNFVWNDLNQDGIRDAGEPGISGATVSLDVNADGTINATTTTDANGFYSFTGLTAGSYKVVFSQPTGFDSVSPFQEGGDSTVDSDADPNNSLMSDVITLNAGETNDTIDAGFFSSVQEPIDYGDLPDTGAGTGPGNYETLSADNGPAHEIVDGLRLGAIVDGETDGQPTSTADGDDLNPASFPDDEDGVTLPTNIEPGQPTTFTVTATNTTGSDATLYGFVDWNNDGDFEDTNESLTTTVPNGTTDGSFDLTFNVPADAVLGEKLGARFRLSTTSDLGSGGSGSGSGSSGGEIGGIDLGSLTDYLFFFADANQDANWQGATKGFVGDVAVDGLQADERTSGGVPYAGTIFTNDSTLGAWADIVDQNDPTDVDPAQAFASTGNTTLISDLEADLNNAFTQINGLTVTAGFENRTADSLNGLNTQNGIAETIVINITDFGLSNSATITGDAEDVFVLRWDEDENFANGYDGQVKFSGGKTIIPAGDLTPANFINVAGDINASGGGSNPAAPPYPQGPRLDDGEGALITNADDFSGGGFFTGYWLTTGDPNKNFENSSLSNGIFVGGWYTTNTKFSMTSGTSGVYVSPNPATQTQLPDGEVEDYLVTVSPAQSSISGNVSEDTNNDNTGDTPLENVTVELLDSGGNVIATTTTDASGNYTFTNQPAGSYTIRQTNLAGYSDVSDIDGGNLNQIAVTLTAGVDSTGNDFIDEVTPPTLANISGNVSEDTNNDNTGDTPLENVTVQLLSNSGTVIATTTTDVNGDYIFTNLEAGNYGVRQINLTGYSDVSDTSGLLKDSIISVTLTPGQDSTGNNFVDEQFASISGTVTEDTNNDDSGDTNLANVTVELLDNTGAVIATTTTDTNGDYSFADVLPGDYTIRQTNLTDYLDVKDTDANNDSQISITLTAGQNSTGNDFVDEQASSISGTVTEDTDDDNNGDNPLENITVELLDSGNNVIATTTTDANGDYSFDDLPAGDYTVRQTNLSDYVDVKDTDTTNDSEISVTLTAGQDSTGNDFVDEQLLGTISGTVTEDTNNDNTGDDPLSGVTLELLDDQGNVIATTTTNGSGNYTFPDVPGGNYTVRQTNLSGYDDVSDTDGANDNLIAVNLSAGGTSSNNNFVDESNTALGTISGNVSADTDNNDIGDTNLENVTVELLDGGAVIDTVTTDASGNYSFINIPAGNYTVRQTNLAGYSNVSDIDGGNLNEIAVTLSTGQDSTGNDFVDEQLLSNISGNVKADTDNDDAGDTNLPSVTVELLDNTGAVIASTTTSGSGNYSFLDYPEGNYTVRQTNLSGYIDVSDIDGDTSNTLNEIAVTLTAGVDSTGNDFVDEQLGSISGNVTEDTDNDNIGNTNMSGVTLELLDDTGAVIASTITDVNGDYSFTDLSPGNYTVSQTNLTNYIDVKDIDATNDSQISVSLTAGQNSTGNDFVDELGGTISGVIFIDTSDDGIYDSGTESLITNQGQGILIELYDVGNNLVASQFSTDGTYEFTGLEEATYSVKQIAQPDGYSDGKDNSPSTGFTSTGGGDADELTGLVIIGGNTLTNNNFGELDTSSKNIIVGGDARDLLNGTTGDDLFVGGKGSDLLNRDANLNGGNDGFYYGFSSEGMDYIFNFDSGDEILITEMLTDEFGLSAPNGSTDISGYIGFENSSSGSYINIFPDGTGTGQVKRLAKVIGTADIELTLNDNGTDYFIGHVV